MENVATKLVAGLVSAAILALLGWVYVTGNRVTATEVELRATQQAVQDIRTDVRDLRRALIGDPPKRAP